MLIVTCPHCECLIHIESINCAIFRHATYKDTNEQIPPHSPQDICNRLVSEGRVWGCGKPFQLVLNSQGKYEPKICDYI